MSFFGLSLFFVFLFTHHGLASGYLVLFKPFIGDFCGVQDRNIMTIVCDSHSELKFANILLLYFALRNFKLGDLVWKALHEIGFIRVVQEKICASKFVFEGNAFGGGERAPSSE